MREVQTTVRCDFCGWGGPYCNPAWFREIAGVDLCRYCASSGPAPVRIETGGHCVTFTDDGRDWACTCGARHCPPLLTPRRVLDAVPSVALAVAVMHLNGRRTAASEAVLEALTADDIASQQLTVHYTPLDGPPLTAACGQTIDGVHHTGHFSLHRDDPTVCQWCLGAQRLEKAQ